MLSSVSTLLAVVLAAGAFGAQEAGRAGRAHARMSDIGVSVESESERHIELKVKSGALVFEDIETRDGAVPGLTFDSLRSLDGDPQPETRAGFSEVPLGGVVPRRRVLVRVPHGMEIALSSSRGRTAAIDSPFPSGITDKLPSEVADLEYVGWLRNERVASVLVHPVTRAEPDGLLEFSADATITLEFTPSGDATAKDLSRPVDGPWFDSIYQGALVNPRRSIPATSVPQALQNGLTITGMTPRPGVTAAPAPSSLSWRLKIRTAGRGVFSITHADLLAAGVQPSSFDPARFQLVRQGEAVPIHVQGEADGRFDPADRILFFASGIEDRYSEQDAWWLQLKLGAPLGLRMAAVSSAPVNAGAPANSGRFTARAEESHRYWSVMPNPGDHDRWYWTRSQAPSMNVAGIEIPSPDPAGAPATVRAFLHGFTNTPQSPDHHTAASINLLFFSDERWDGITPFTHEGTVPAATLTAGTNQLAVTQINDTGALVDTIYIDRYEVEYERLLESDGGTLEWRVPALPGPSDYEVDGFASEDLLALDVTDPSAPVRLIGPVTSASPTGYRGTFSFMAATPSELYVSSPDGWRTPLSIEFAPPPPSPPASGSDLVMIAERDLWPALAPLVQARTQAGLRVSLHAPSDIYDAYSFGDFDPRAIRDFLADAYANWTAPAPSFVLLVGEASYDFKNFTGHGTPNSAPGRIYYSPAQGEIVSDHLHVRVVGNDPLPDMFIGRLPALDASDAAQLVSNLLAYEAAGSSGGGWTHAAVHAADFGGLFTGALNAATPFLPASFTVHNAFADVLGSKAATRAEIVARMNAGVGLVTFLGHGSVTTWSGSIMNPATVASLANGDRLPVVTALNCLNGYFAIPSPHRSLAEELMLAPNGGAIANVAPSGLAYLWELNRIIERFYVRYSQNNDLGEMFLGSLLDAYATSGIHEENLAKMILFGDPTLNVH